MKFTPMDLSVNKFTMVTVVQDIQESNKKHKDNTNGPWISMKRNKVNVGMKLKMPLVTFQGCMSTLLTLGQILALIPLSGVRDKNASGVKFVRRSWKWLYTFLSFLGQMYMTIMCTFSATSADATLKATTTVIFYATICTTMLLFTRAAKLWPRLVLDIAKVEELEPITDATLTRRCHGTCIFVVSLAMVEHGLSLWSAYSAGRLCYPDRGNYEGFALYFYPWVFNTLPYSLLLAMVTQFIHFQCTFIWSYSDLFVICNSYYLTSRLHQINKKLKASQGKYLPEMFWRSVREEYGRTTQLVRKVDETISPITFVSFANNLFFICFQLFNTLENGFKGRVQCNTDNAKVINHRIPEMAAYFLFSLVYLISRSVSVMLIAAQVNTASNVPAPVLYDVPSPVYCTEVQRFLDQVNGDLVALSGLQFFSIRRGLLLTVAGTIVTYELVMVQFSGPSSPITAGTASTPLALLPNTTIT